MHGAATERGAARAIRVRAGRKRRTRGLVERVYVWREPRVTQRLVEGLLNSRQPVVEPRVEEAARVDFDVVLRQRINLL